MAPIPTHASVPHDLDRWLSANATRAMDDLWAVTSELRDRMGPPPEVEALVKQLAPQYAIDPQLVMALISVESGFNDKAVSPKNAQGLMQLIPETAERFDMLHVAPPMGPPEVVRGSELADAAGWV